MTFDATAWAASVLGCSRKDAETRLSSADQALEERQKQERRQARAGARTQSIIPAILVKAAEMDGVLNDLVSVHTLGEQEDREGSIA